MKYSWRGVKTASSPSTTLVLRAIGCLSTETHGPVRPSGDEYKDSLSVLLGQETKLTQKLYATAAAHPQRVVFAEAIHPTMLKAAVQAKAEGICQPVLLGNDEVITKLAKSLDLSLEGIEIVNLRHPNEQERRERYARILTEKRQRDGYTFQEANDKMFERNYFGMMMVETGEADAFLTGLYTKYSNTIKVANEVIGIRPEYQHFGAMHIINSPKGTYYIADTMINENPDSDTLVDLAKLAATAVRFFNEKPVIGMVSHSNFGSSTSSGAKKVKKAVEQMQELYPDFKKNTVQEGCFLFAVSNQNYITGKCNTINTRQECNRLTACFDTSIKTVSSGNFHCFFFDVAGL